MASATADSVESAPLPTQEATAPRSKRSLVLGLIAAAVICGGGFWYVTHHGLEDTDNAQIDGDVISVPSRIGGVVTKIAFTENQRVKAGRPARRDRSCTGASAARRGRRQRACC